MAGKILSLITVPKAIAAGVACGAAAVLLGVGFAFWPELLVLPYFLALVATALCGLYILLATWRDAYRHPRRGVRIRPIRSFDLAAGLLLAAPALWALAPFLRAF